jgi:hypothetical protein
MLRHLLLSLIGLVLAFGSAAPASADPVTVVTVAHGPVSAVLDPVTAGTSSPGDLRTYYTPLTMPGKKRAIGFLTGSLLTTAVGTPAVGRELRTADLVFTVGAARNQLVVGGVAAYDQQAPTVAQRSSVVRPVVGGSGKYAGARGWCRSVHRKDGTWRHTFGVEVRP